jgi:nitrite reductase/ring-hydroxylating ferredoxin subunit
MKHLKPSRRGVICGPLLAAATTSVCAAAPRDCCQVPAGDPSAIRLEPGLIHIDLARERSLRARGGSIRIVDPVRSLEVIDVHAVHGRYAAFDRKCTHGSGPLVYVPQKNVLHCTCWGHSQFTLTGAVAAGPAKVQLRAYRTSLTGSTLTVHLEVLA